MKLYELGAGDGLASWRQAERDVPVTGRGQVLVRIRAVSLNYRDILLVTGRYGVATVRPDLIPVSDGAGEVVSVGEGVTKWKAGDRVAGIFAQSWHGGAQVDDAWATALGGAIDGMLAEYVVLDAEGLVRLPAHLSFEEGATLPCAAVTAWNALYALKQVRAGETVLALGTGGVSVFAAQFAKAAGARVIVTSSSDDKLARARELGVHDTINYRSTPEWHEEVRRLTDGRGVNHVIEIGGPGTISRSIASVHPGGIVSLIGMLAQGEKIDPMPILQTGAVVRGVYTGSREIFEEMNRAIVQHELRPVIDRVFDFAEAKSALQTLDTASHFGKIVIRVGN
jgi:NADPH:quinone reductase-like Zn-dependent oxidoreductase